MEAFFFLASLHKSLLAWRWWWLFDFAFPDASKFRRPPTVALQFLFGSQKCASLCALARSVLESSSSIAPFQFTLILIIDPIVESSIFIYSFLSNCEGQKSISILLSILYPFYLTFYLFYILFWSPMFFSFPTVKDETGILGMKKEATRDHNTVPAICCTLFLMIIWGVNNCDIKVLMKLIFLFILRIGLLQKHITFLSIRYTNSFTSPSLIHISLFGYYTHMVVDESYGCFSFVCLFVCFFGGVGGEGIIQ